MQVLNQKYFFPAQTTKLLRVTVKERVLRGHSFISLKGDEVKDFVTTVHKPKYKKS